MDTKVKRNYSNLNATVAKLHAVYGKRLSQGDYTALMNCTSVSDAAAYLKKNTHYSRTLQDLDENTVHRGVLEDMLRRSFIEEYYRLIGFEKIGDSEFYSYITAKTETEEILVCIQHIIAGSEDHINTLPIYMKRYTSFDIMELTKVRTFSQLLEVIAKTPYYQLLKDFAPEDDINADYAACELKLWIYYYNRLLSSLDAFDKNTRSRLRYYIGLQIDTINIANSYRMIRYFHADANYIKPKMIPIYIGVPEKKFDELYASADMQSFVSVFKQTKYGREIEKRGLPLDDVERAVLLYRYKETKRAFSRSRTASECFYTFNWLLDLEVKNIIRIIKGIRYSLPVRDISELLILKCSPFVRQCGII